MTTTATTATRATTAINALRRRAPRLFLALRTLRYALRPERLAPETAAIAASLCGDELRVLSGPFRGLRYLPFSSGSGLLPKLVGSYEVEVHTAVETACERGYRTVVNIGCGEGYYAVGLAKRMPNAEVHAFDLDIVAQQRTRRLARANGVAERVHVAGLCDFSNLSRLVGPQTLVVSDCEGCEATLLDPAKVPALSSTDLLVELHDFLDPTISETIYARFAATHQIFTFAMSDRASYSTPELDRLAPRERELAMWEGRPVGMTWVWMTSRASRERAA